MKTSSQPTKIKIKDLRAKHLQTDVEIEGKLIQASEIRPQCISSKFECPKCNITIQMQQLDSIFKGPERCSCGNKKDFILVSKEMIDTQRIILAQGQEVYDELYEKKVPQHRISVFLQEKLCSPDIKIFESLGKNARVIGNLFEKPIPMSEPGTISTKFDIAIEAKNIEIK